MISDPIDSLFCCLYAVFQDRGAFGANPHAEDELAGMSGIIVAAADVKICAGVTTEKITGFVRGLRMDFLHDTLPCPIIWIRKD